HSAHLRGFTPPLNVGYEARFGETKLDSFDYRAGTEIAATPKLTMAVDMIGLYRPHASTLFRSVVLGDQHLLGRSEIDGVIGGKWRGTTDRALLFNLLVPLNTSRTRPGRLV